MRLFDRLLIIVFCALGFALLGAVLGGWLMRVAVEAWYGP